MTCEQITELIPGFIRREIETGKRIEAVEHLQSCPNCRSAYLSQLTFFYELDKNIVKPSERFEITKFKTGINDTLQISKKPNYNRIKWYGSVAAVLLILIISMRFFLIPDKNAHYSNIPAPKNVIQTALEKEDWPHLQRILVNSEKLRSHADEQIPLTLLIDKLQRLERSGVQLISFMDLYTQAQNANPEPIQNQQVNSGTSAVRIDVLIKALQEFSPYTDRTTLLEISTYLDKNKPGGTDS